MDQDHIFKQKQSHSCYRMKELKKRKLYILNSFNTSEQLGKECRLLFAVCWQTQASRHVAYFHGWPHDASIVGRKWISSSISRFMDSGVTASTFCKAQGKNWCSTARVGSGKITVVKDSTLFPSIILENMRTRNQERCRLLLDAKNARVMTVTSSVKRAIRTVSCHASCVRGGLACRVRNPRLPLWTQNQNLKK